MRTRFGVTVVPSASGRTDPVADAVRAEALGLDLVTVWDHPHGDRPSFETWTLMTWIAARTSRIAIGSNVLGLPFRLPALTAKMAETLDRLSGGRLVLGLGAGGGDDEAAGYGAPVRSRRDKIDALEEALELIRGAWREPAFTFAGSHYRTTATLLEPKPARPIPVWLGTYGRRGIALAARLADGWVPSMPYLPPARARSKLAALHAELERQGRDRDAFDYAYNVSVRVGGPPADDPGRQVAGEPDEVVERVLELLDLGFTVLNFWVSGRRDEQLERLATEIVPTVRQVVG